MGAVTGGGGGGFFGDIFDAVGSVVESVAHVVDEVAVTVGNTVDAVIKNPVPILLAVAGSTIGIPPAVTMATIAAARGGDLEDIALSAGMAYLAPAAGSAISSTVSEAFIEAGMNESFSQVASTAISKGLINGTVAEIKGGSFEDGFAGGFTGGLVSGGVGDVGSLVKDDVIALAQGSGLDLKNATSLYNAGAKALSAGINSEITGKGDFATSFANSAINSGVNSGTNYVNTVIDDQFKAIAADWNKGDATGNVVTTDVSGAGVPNDIVNQVTVSEIGVNSTPEERTPEINNLSSAPEAAAPDIVASTTENLPYASPEIPIINTPEATAPVVENIGMPEVASVLPEAAAPVVAPTTEQALAEAPQAETTNNFIDLTASPVNAPAENATASASDALATVNETPSGGLAAVSPITEAPIASDLLTNDLPADTSVGGLNAVATKTADDKMAESQGLKPTDLIKPATFGSLIKSALTQGRRPARQTAAKTFGGLQAARNLTRPPARSDISKLIPIQRAAAPARSLPSSAKLRPVTNFAGLSSLLKRKG